MSERKGLTSLKKGEQIPVEGNWLILFSSEGCGPCKPCKDILEKIYSGWPGANFLLVDTTVHPRIVMSLSIRAVPTTIFVKEGIEQSTRIMGVFSKRGIEDTLKRIF